MFLEGLLCLKFKALNKIQQFVLTLQIPLEQVMAEWLRLRTLDSMGQVVKSSVRGFWPVFIILTR